MIDTESSISKTASPLSPVQISFILYVSLDLNVLINLIGLLVEICLDFDLCMESLASISTNMPFQFV